MPTTVRAVGLAGRHPSAAEHLGEPLHGALQSPPLSELRDPGRAVREAGVVMAVPLAEANGNGADHD